MAGRIDPPRTVSLKKLDQKHHVTPLPSLLPVAPSGVPRPVRSLRSLTVSTLVVEFHPAYRSLRSLTEK
ncbi:hypothetical protein [Haladaptatus sp. CMAA 1911]|uniref:hypothetical protein n=1 Tax=unclassified Haladaptatus TaxID=2622732 RepID=UPI0037546C9C